MTDNKLKRHSAVLNDPMLLQAGDEDSNPTAYIQWLI